MSTEPTPTPTPTPTSTSTSTSTAIAAERSSRRAVWAVVLVGLAVRGALAAAVPLTTDEAYYVDWARHLAAGYLDHPPLVAWLIAGPLSLFGHHELAVRLPALLLQAGTTLLAASLARALAGRRAAVALALMLQAAPVFSVGAFLVTPDAPLAFGWAGTLWAVERAASRCPRWWLAAGLFLGLAALAKLHAGLLGLALLAAALATAEGRRALRTPWPWLAAALALLVCSPFLLWNAHHGWATFAFQASHGLRGRSLSALRLVGWLCGQAGYVSPLLLGLAAGAAWRALRSPPSALAPAALAFSALPVAAFFASSAAFTPGALPHWAAPAWLSALVLLAAAGVARLRAALLLGGVMTALLLAAVPVAPRLVEGPLDELRGWREAVEEARRLAPGARLATTHWMALGHLGWYAQEPLVYVSDRFAGPSLYASPRDERPLLVVAPEGLGPDRSGLERLLGPVAERGELAVRYGGRVVRRYRFYERR